MGSKCKCSGRCLRVTGAGRWVREAAVRARSRADGCAAAVTLKPWETWRTARTRTDPLHPNPRPKPPPDARVTWRPHTTRSANSSRHCYRHASESNTLHTHYNTTHTLHTPHTHYTPHTPPTHTTHPTHTHYKHYTHTTHTTHTHYTHHTTTTHTHYHTHTHYTPHTL